MYKIFRQNSVMLFQIELGSKIQDNSLPGGSIFLLAKKNFENVPL